MQGSTRESLTQTHMGLILLRVALRGVCEFPSPRLVGGSSGLTHRLPVAALAALLCFVHINIKHVFQLDLFHPRRPSRSLWLLPCLTPLPTTSQSAVGHSPWSSQALHLAHPWSPTCGGMAVFQRPVESSPSTDRFSVFSSNIWCSEFPSKSLL